MFIIWQSVLLCSILYNNRKVFIMHVTNIREKVMLYLTVKAADEPVQEPALWCKVGSIKHLVHRPVVLHLPLVCRHRELTLFHHVRELEYA